MWPGPVRYNGEREKLSDLGYILKISSRECNANRER